MKPNKEEAQAAWTKWRKNKFNKWGSVARSSWGALVREAFKAGFQAGRKITPDMIERGHEAIAATFNNLDGDYIEQAEACLKAALGGDDE